ncbi:MAG: PEP-CTERM sorting domain-containing protein [Planctomycetota bacterium]
MTFAYDLDGDGLFDDFTGQSGMFGPLDPARPGETFDIGVRVTDGEGGDATAFQTFTVIPEPASLLLVGLGSLLVFSSRRGG